MVFYLAPVAACVPGNVTVEVLVEGPGKRWQIVETTGERLKWFVRIPRLGGLHHRYDFAA
jgi:hypothetical protein